MQQKTFPVEIKAADADTGTFTALVSAFGNVDSHGDRVMPGAFRETLKRWRESGDPIPVVLSHKHDDPLAHIGVADPADVEETDEGLLAKGTLDVADNDVARHVHRLMKRRSLKGFSFGYTVPDGGERKADEDDAAAYELLEVDLIELGPTLKGANDRAEVRAVKSALEESEQTEREREDSPDDQSSGEQAELSRRITDAQLASRGIIPAGGTD
jgi:HK97 family phage prohead protease